MTFRKTTTTDRRRRRPAASPSGSPSARATVRRHPERARYDRLAVHAILDEGLVCHVGFVDRGQPLVIPTAYARLEERLVIHGSRASRLLSRLASGAPVCVTVTLLDGLVLARSAFSHSMNYRSVVVLGRARELVTDDEKRRALDAIVEHVVPGRGGSIRPPSAAELRATRVVALPLDESTAKLREGPPLDAAADLALPCWAGVLPLRVCPLEPIADARLRGAAIALPSHVARWRRPADEAR